MVASASLQRLASQPWQLRLQELIKAGAFKYGLTVHEMINLLDPERRFETINHQSVRAWCFDHPAWLWVRDCTWYPCRRLPEQFDLPPDIAARQRSVAQRKESEIEQALAIITAALDVAGSDGIDHAALLRLVHEAKPHIRSLNGCMRAAHQRGLKIMRRTVSKQGRLIYLYQWQPA